MTSTRKWGIHMKTKAAQRELPLWDKGAALKYDGEKPRMELLPTAPLLGVARVLTFGAHKYADHNWRLGFDYSRLIGAAYRHLSAYNDGEDVDPESGESHIDHAICTLMFLSEQIAKGTGKDDRYRS